MSIFGGTFKPFVIRQLKARQALMAHGLNTPNNQRSLNVQLYTSAKTSWVKMSSFVNYSPKPGEIPESDALARKYVLLGGTLWDNPAEPLKPELKFGVDNGKSAYSSKDGLGHKLMPGIESISVNNEGAYGSLRSATIIYKCWTKQQLDDLEILYMRVGYPVLLEWGWSMYLDTSKTGDSDYTRKSDKGDLDVSATDLNSYITKPIKSWDSSTINPFDSNKTLETLYDDIERLNFKYNGNYDGLVGIVKNFSYKIEVDGSYTCTTNLISMGDALASIKMNRANTDNNTEDDNVEGYKTGFTALMSRLTVGVTTTGQGANQSRTIKLSDFVAPESISTIPGIDAKTIVLSKFANNPYDSTTAPTYIQLSFLIALINANFNTYLDGNPLVNIELPIYNREFNSGNGLCLASIDSVSIDPSVCIIKNKDASWITENPEGYYPKELKDAGVYMQEFLIRDEASAAHNLGQIGNVYVCIQYVTKVFNDVMSSKASGEVGIYEFLKKVLDGVSYALGSINDFDVYVTDSKAVIIDKNYTELPSKSKKDSKFELNIFGIDSVVRDFKITSKIFESQAYQMGIAAGGQMNVGGVNTSTQNYFNRGLKNRLYTTISETPNQGTGTTEFDRKVEEARNVLNLTKYLNDFLERSTYPATEGSIPSANTHLKQVLLTVNNDVNYRAVIPISVEVTLDGIAGIAIGEVFRLNTNMLPKDYDNKNIGFIVSSLKHTIANSQWLTTMGAYVILLDQGEGVKSSGGLSSYKKAELTGYKEAYKTKVQAELANYRLTYIKILHFLAEYFAGNLTVGLYQTVYAIDLQTGQKYVKGTEPRLGPDGVGRNYRFEAEPYKFKRLYIKNPIYSATDYNAILAELNAPYPEGDFIQKRYQLMPSVNEVEKGSTGFLDTLKRGLNEKQALDKSKEIVKKELNRLTDYKLLVDKAKPLADDIIQIIDAINFNDTSKSKLFKASVAGVGKSPIKPKLNSNGMDVDYREREGEKILIIYNPADNIE